MTEHDLSSMDGAPRPVWVDGAPGAARITEDVASVLEGRPTRGWWQLFGAAGLAFLLGALAIGYEIATGIGTWGLNRTVD